MKKLTENQLNNLKTVLYTNNLVEGLGLCLLTAVQEDKVILTKGTTFKNCKHHDIVEVSLGTISFMYKSMNFNNTKEEIIKALEAQKKRTIDTIEETIKYNNKLQNLQYKTKRFYNEVRIESNKKIKVLKKILSEFDSLIEFNKTK